MLYYHVDYAAFNTQSTLFLQKNNNIIDYTTNTCIQSKQKKLGS